MESAINISQQRMERMEMFAINGQTRLFENSGRGVGIQRILRQLGDGIIDHAINASSSISISYTALLSS